MSLALLILILFTWIVGLKIYKPFSFVAAGLLGFTIYSIPAVLGVVYPFHTTLAASPRLAPADPQSVLATIFAWITFLVTISIRLPNQTANTRHLTPGNPHYQQQELSLTISLLIMCAAGYSIIAATDGPLFFLEQRDDQAETYTHLLWRWINSAGLVASVYARHWRASVIFLIALFVYFIAGDRTIIVITAICLGVVSPRGQTILRMFFRIRSFSFISILATIVFFGKPIYNSLKTGRLDYLEQSMTADWIERSLAAFEPFLTFNILDLVVKYDFKTSVLQFLEGLMGQLLILPSAFGIDSNYFNVIFTNKFAPLLHYGVAGNYWAQGWSLGGIFGVGIYAVIYGISLRACDRGVHKYAGTRRVLIALIGALIAVYAHRNSLNNLLSFVRQLIIVALVAAVLAKMITPLIPSCSRRINSLNLKQDTDNQVDSDISRASERGKPT